MRDGKSADAVTCTSPNFLGRTFCKRKLAVSCNWRLGDWPRTERTVFFDKQLPVSLLTHHHFLAALCIYSRFRWRSLHIWHALHPAQLRPPLRHAQLTQLTQSTQSTPSATTWAPTLYATPSRATLVLYSIKESLAAFCESLRGPPGSFAHWSARYIPRSI